jgi:hypothetical protein
VVPADAQAVSGTCSRAELPRGLARNSTLQCSNSGGREEREEYVLARNCLHAFLPGRLYLGNAASSAIFVLPRSEKYLPMLWLNPVTPGTGLYLPIFMDGERLPALLSNAGTAGKTVTVTPVPQVPFARRRPMRTSGSKTRCTRRVQDKHVP